jgi:prevent-host-death family protein
LKYDHISHIMVLIIGDRQVSEIGILEAKTHLSSCVDRALAGEEVILTRHGKRVVKLVPVQSQGQRQARVAELIQRIVRNRNAQPRRKEPTAGELVSDGRKW